MARSRANHHDLESAVPYLLARAGTCMGNAFAKVTKDYGLGLTEWRVCAALNHVPGQTLSELVRHASMDMSALSRIVDRLIAQDLVARRRNPADGRAVSLSLTPAGLALTRKLIPHAQRYERVALSGFTDEEANKLRDFLGRIYVNANALP